MNKFSKAKIILLVVLLAVFQLAVNAQSVYSRANLWEKEIAAFVRADKEEFPKKGKILFVGSSSIRGWKTLKDDFSEFYTINRGFGGSHLEDVNFYADQIVFRYEPKLIVLYAGENDLVAGKSVETVFDDFVKFVASVRNKLPKSRVVAISVKPSPERWVFAAKFKRFNDLMRAETEKDKRLLFADVWTPMLGADGEPLKNIFLGDNVHMNADGYKIWRETLLPAVKFGSKGNFR